MENKIFDLTAVLKRLKRIGKVFLYLLLTMLIGALIGCWIASGNPFAIFLPSTWFNFFQFVN